MSTPEPPNSGGLAGLPGATVPASSDTVFIPSSSQSRGYTPTEPPLGAEEERSSRPGGSQAGADFGLLILRLVLGGLFIAHGLQVVFGLIEGPGVDGFTDMVNAAGYRAAGPIAVGVGVAMLLAGALLVIGLLTPLASAILAVVTVNIIAVRWDDGLLLTTERLGFEPELALTAMAVTLAYAGPGRLAFDSGRAWFRRSGTAATIFLLLAAGACVFTLLVLRNP